MRLNDSQKRAIRLGSPAEWRSARGVGVHGTTMDALARRGLADVRLAQRPYRHFVYRLTTAGNELRVEWLLEEAAKPIEHERIRVRCTFCGAEFADGTPGGSCGSCGMEVAAIT